MSRRAIQGVHHLEDVFGCILERSKAILDAAFCLAMPSEVESDAVECGSEPLVAKLRMEKLVWRGQEGG